MRRVLVVVALVSAPFGCAGPPPRPAPAAAPAIAAPVIAEHARRSPAERDAWLDAEVARRVRAGRAPGPVPVGEADEDLVTCRMLADAGRGDDARAAYAATLRVNGGDPFVAFAVARFRLGDGDVRGAVELLEPLAAGAFDHPDLRWLCGAARFAGGDADGGEPLLRAELAEGSRFAEAAFALCDAFVDGELFADARAVVAAARRRDPTRADLRLVEARLLQDTWQLDAAERALRELLAAEPALDAARYQLADVLRSQGRPEPARLVLDAIAADAPWSRENIDRLAALREDLDGERPTLGARDLLAMVRGAEGIGQRMRALQSLLGVPATRERAIFVGFSQDEPVLRVMALRAVPGDAPGLAAALQVALGDPDPRVRALGVRRTVELGDRELAVRLASELLEAEEDPYAFRSAHEALAARLGPRVALPLDGERDARIRSQIREAWRQQCPE